ncbi:hypothetical protein GCM10011297_30570 [Bacterioplanes sanyensis]|uniref:helix-turn-helix transcriptional regulator n=1 Tax=Bacterioplanes sanyensis TaxID=1249553 RepID=UPI00167A6905|nr:helix-turn-helix transcriptional regulator [Bacterioplanes sanyensis]GGY55689.1 hypothetical protein GCM10011297_30570 [Bacterioplanes sanyensis]
MALAGRLSSKQQQRIGVVLAHIEQHLDGNLTLTGLADVAGCSRWQLQRAFAELNIALASYVRQRRLSRATWLLVHSEQRQIDIAKACGFESDIQFHRVFKQYLQMTPGAYRRRGVWQDDWPALAFTDLNQCWLPSAARSQAETGPWPLAIADGGFSAAAAR